MKKISFKKAFTIIEILVAVAILGLITIAISSFQVNVSRYNKSAADSLQSALDARSILRTMVKELRSMGIGNNGAYPLEEAATSSITFYTDTDSDGLKEKVRYFSEGTTLKKGVIIPTGSPYIYASSDEKFQTLAYSIKNSVSTPLFEYFDDTYTGTSSPIASPVSISLVKLVKISLLIDADPNYSPIPRTYTSQVNLRNLKDNL